MHTYQIERGPEYGINEIERGNELVDKCANVVGDIHILKVGNPIYSFNIRDYQEAYVKQYGIDQTIDGVQRKFESPRKGDQSSRTFFSQ